MPGAGQACCAARSHAHARLTVVLLPAQAGSGQPATPCAAVLTKALREHAAESARAHLRKAAQARAVLDCATQRLAQAQGNVGKLVDGYLDGMRWGCSNTRKPSYPHQDHESYSSPEG